MVDLRPFIRLPDKCFEVFLGERFNFVLRVARQELPVGLCQIIIRHEIFNLVRRVDGRVDAKRHELDVLDAFLDERFIEFRHVVRHRWADRLTACEHEVGHPYLPFQIIETDHLFILIHIIERLDLPVERVFNLLAACSEHRHEADQSDEHPFLHTFHLLRCQLRLTRQTRSVIKVNAVKARNGIVTNPNQLMYCTLHGTPCTHGLMSAKPGTF